MLYKTRGIALSFIKYKESSIIARIFTESFGMQSYIVNSIRSKTAKTKIALFQPLTLLDLVVYHHKKKDINRISELKCNCTFHTIPFDIRKTSVALFLTELLNLALLDEGENEALFEFLNDSIQLFDVVERDFEIFHLQFIMQLTKYLGIMPVSGISMLKEIGHSKAYNNDFCAKVDFFLRSNYEEYLRLNKVVRGEILMAIINYYRFHYDSVKEFKSIQVLREVLN